MGQEMGENLVYLLIVISNLAGTITTLALNIRRVDIDSADVL